MPENILPSANFAPDAENPVIKLCIAGTQAEFQNRMEDAATLFTQAWQTAQDDYEACVAAHYVARAQNDLVETLCWNQTALLHADMVEDERITNFYPSLYLSLGRSYELLGEQPEAQKYYALAAQLGVTHQDE